ncbi:MAG: winged helix-turn-helix domain-containing protein [Clostridiales bacterium]|nr:winged helix-turn-helix domain-containing protein [Clostridiales bacterium]
MYESVWGGAYVGDDKTVNVHISNLRAKLAGHSPHNHIKTVWGVGFRLAE